MIRAGYRMARASMWRGVRALNERKRGAIHLFLLSPPLSGSTALAQLVRTSPHATVFRGNGEGQFLPEAKPLLLLDRRWDPALEIDWRRIREIFLSHWSPFKSVRFEKSPPHLVRALDLEKTFENAHFLVTIRDPYAQIEGLLRRGWSFGEFGPQSTRTTPVRPRAAAEFWVRTALWQHSNLERLERTCFFTYEQLTSSTPTTIRRILDFVPALRSMDLDSRLTAHNVTGMPIQGLKNLNAQKIAKLSAAQLDEINVVLSRHTDVLSFFDYALVTDPQAVGERRRASS